MRALSANDILRLWELHEGQSPIERALGLLCAALPNFTRDELAALPIGQRDSLLLSLRDKILGKVLRSYTECPSCEGRLELTLNSHNLRITAPKPSDSAELTHGLYRIQFRLPNSNDLSIVEAAHEPATALSRLLGRCVLSVQRSGVPIELKNLPPEVIDALASTMSELDPQGEILLSLRCPSCRHAWDSLLDISAFLFAEFTAIAKQLIRDVHTLAQAYGWREADILAMSSRRRQLYLELVES